MQDNIQVLVFILKLSLLCTVWCNTIVEGIANWGRFIMISQDTGKNATFFFSPSIRNCSSVPYALKRKEKISFFSLMFITFQGFQFPYTSHQYCKCIIIDNKVKCLVQILQTDSQNVSESIILLRSH